MKRSASERTSGVTGASFGAQVSGFDGHQDGPKVKETQTLTVHYTGKIWGADKQFDSSWERGQPAEFPLGQVIQGWQKGLAGVPVGSRVVMSIPPSLGYGDQEQQGIPANSTLVFVVDVLAAY